MLCCDTGPLAPVTHFGHAVVQGFCVQYLTLGMLWNSAVSYHWTFWACCGTGPLATVPHFGQAVVHVIVNTTTHCAGTLGSTSPHSVFAVVQCHGKLHHTLRMLRYTPKSTPPHYVYDMVLTQLQLRLLHTTISGHSIFYMVYVNHLFSTAQLPLLIFFCPIIQFPNIYSSTSLLKKLMYIQ